MWAIYSRVLIEMDEPRVEKGINMLQASRAPTTFFLLLPHTRPSHIDQVLLTLFKKLFLETFSGDILIEMDEPRVEKGINLLQASRAPATFFASAAHQAIPQ